MLFTTKKTFPYQQIFWAFLLTIILFLGINITFTNKVMAGTNNLPNSVAKAVLQDASKRSRLPLKQLRIVESRQRNWADGCLEITQPGIICTQQVVPGWQVKVVGGRQSLIYRTNNSGSVVKLGSI